MTSSTSLLVEKLLAAEAAVLQLAQGFRPTALTSDQRERLSHDALNKVRGALQLAQADAPDVSRQPHTVKPGKGLGGGHSVVEDHESFGVISLSKPQGRMRLVGAMMDSLPTCVELKVHRARRDIDTQLHTEHYYPQEQLIRVRMSSYQWAELITSMQGQLSPCTIDTVMGVHMDPVPEDVKTGLEQIVHDSRAEAQRKMTDGEGAFFAAIDKLVAELPNLKVSKKREDELRESLEALKNHVQAPKAAAEWAHQRMTEDTEKTLSQARVEMAAALQSLIQRAGLQAMEKSLSEAFHLQLNGGPAPKEA